MKVAITRPPSPLTDGWIAVPVTSRIPIRSGIDAFAEVLETEPDGTWIAVTSPHTFKLLAARGVTVPERFRLACVGEATAKAAPRKPEFVGPPPASAESMVEAFPDGSGTILFPASAMASRTLEEGLVERGYSVDRFDIYSSEADPAGVLKLANQRADAIIVTAGSAALAIHDHWPASIELPPLIAFGEPTQRTLASAGIPAARTSATPDRTGLEACLERI